MLIQNDAECQEELDKNIELMDVKWVEPGRSGFAIFADLRCLFSSNSMRNSNQRFKNGLDTLQST